MKIAIPIILLAVIVACSYYLYSYQVVAVTPTTTPSATQTPVPTPVKTEGELAIEIYGLVNKYRVEQGLESLTYSDKLRESARMKSEDLFTNNYWSHTSPDGKDPWYWVKKAGYQYQYAGENLSRDYVEPERIVEAWKASKTHNENLLNKNYTQSGVYYHCESVPYNSCIAVMHYARPVNVLGAQTIRVAPKPTSAPTLSPPPTTAPTPKPYVSMSYPTFVPIQLYTPIPVVYNTSTPAPTQDKTLLLSDCLQKARTNRDSGQMAIGVLGAGDSSTAEAIDVKYGNEVNRCNLLYK